MSKIIKYENDVELRKAVLADPKLINLHQLPDKKCKKCWGKGNIGKINGKPIPCKCFIKALEKKIEEIERLNKFGVTHTDLVNLEAKKEELDKKFGK